MFVMYSSTTEPKKTILPGLDRIFSKSKSSVCPKPRAAPPVGLIRVRFRRRKREVLSPKVACAILIRSDFEIWCILMSPSLHEMERRECSCELILSALLISTSTLALPFPDPERVTAGEFGLCKTRLNTPAPPGASIENEAVLAAESIYPPRAFERVKEI